MAGGRSSRARGGRGASDASGAPGARGVPRLDQAFDEIQFGPSRTLNLRESLPTAEEAVRRTEQWLRERQVARAGEVLVITGSGRGSVGGVPVVRDAVQRLFTTLRRRGVITAAREHTSGSFVVRLAPVTALFEGGQRKREPRMPRETDPVMLQGLEPETRRLLRALAERTLEQLGASHLEGRFVKDEMVRQFNALAAGIPEGPEREARLREAALVALEELE